MRKSPIILAQNKSRLACQSYLDTIVTELFPLRKEYNILVTPSSREIDDNVAGLEESARNCRRDAILSSKPHRIYFLNNCGTFKGWARKEQALRACMESTHRQVASLSAT